HHKPCKKDMRKWRTKKKKHGDHYFELGPKIKVENESLIRRITVNVQLLKEYLRGDLDRAKSSITSLHPPRRVAMSS
ncbi:hypothetical protein PanWU01x14_232060, partial [Parasponia andersonii]